MENMEDMNVFTEVTSAGASTKPSMKVTSTKPSIQVFMKVMESFAEVIEAFMEVT